MQEREVPLYEQLGDLGRLYYNRQRGRIRLVERSADLEVFRSSADGDRSSENGDYPDSVPWVPFEPGESVDAPLHYQGALAFRSAGVGRREAVLENVLPSGEVQDQLRVRVDAYRLSIDVDADRDGEVGVDEPRKDKWVWGKDKPGAIVLVNNDREHSDVAPGEGETSELADLLVRTEFPTEMSDVTLNLYATKEDANRFSVYGKNSDETFERILGRAPRSGEPPLELSPPLNPEGEHCLMEAHEFPSPSFEGLLTIELFLTIPAVNRPGYSLIGRDRVVFRVAPWIMTPNTLPVERIYACSMITSGQGGTDGDKSSNSAFLEGLKKVCASEGGPVFLEIIPPEVNEGDRWIQDEVEFGYSQSPSHTLPVVCDSPRDRTGTGLDAYPELWLRAPDVGHFEVEVSSDPSSLDSFGNLEVSPPVTVGERHYPLGRVIFGGSHYGVYGELPPRRMLPELRRFLHAQKVQSPIEIFTDWLHVGHVDEMLTFVPADNEKEFKLLLASPSKAQAILQGLRDEGFGSEIIFKGKKRRDPEDPKGRRWVSAETTVDGLLDQAEFWDVNAHFQQLIDLNREILKESLGLDDADVFAIPVLFSGRTDEVTGAFFPNMVNHLVIGRTSVVPKPYGPVIEGEDGGKVDAFEKAFCETLPERKVRFIDDWYSYHQMMGEVHCGTNARRAPFPDVHWWEHRPEGVYDL